MSLNWMPWHIGDYRRDTGHLSTLEHGAYLLLISHYWETGPLPDDDRQLAQITLLSRKAWGKLRPTMAQFFKIGSARGTRWEANAKQLLGNWWFHKRIDRELEKAENLSLKRKIAGQIGGRVSKGKNNTDRFVTQAIAKQMGGQPPRKKEEEAFEEERKPASKEPWREASPILTANIRAKNWN